MGPANSSRCSSHRTRASPIRIVSELCEQGGQAGDVVDVGVGQQDRLNVRQPPAHEIDHQPGLEVGVDDDGVVGVFVLDEIGVGAELAVGGGFDADRHRVLRTMVWCSVSR